MLTAFRMDQLQGSVSDTAEQLSALAGSHDSAAELFLYLKKLGLTGNGLLEVVCRFGRAPVPFEHGKYKQPTTALALVTNSNTC